MNKEFVILSSDAKVTVDSVASEFSKLGVSSDSKRVAIRLGIRLAVLTYSLNWEILEDSVKFTVKGIHGISGTGIGIVITIAFVSITFPLGIFSLIYFILILLVLIMYYVEIIQVNKKIEISLNSICQSLAIAGGLENKTKTMLEIANQLETSQQPHKNKDLQCEKVPSQRKIIEKRKLPGKLKVFASWYLIWNTIHQIVWDVIFAIVLCNILIVCTSSNLPSLRNSRILLAACTSIVHINMRMNSKAKNRWKLKYGDVDYNDKGL